MHLPEHEKNIPLKYLASVAGGSKRLVRCRHFNQNSDIWILDEPSAGQDYRSYTEIMKFIDVLNREYGKTILFITHDMHLALENTDRALAFSDSRLVADESVSAVLADDTLIREASLKQTSLYTLAQKLSLSPEQVTRRFIEHERKVRVGE